MTKSERNDKPSNLPAFLIGVVVGAFGAVLILFLKGQSWDESKFATISQMIVQLDAFLTAGAAVGISVYWSSYANTIRKLASRFQQVSVELDELKPGSLNSPEREYVRNEISKRERTHLPVVFYGISAFVISAVLAVVGEMFSDMLALALSLIILITGTGFMFLSWYFLNFYGAILNRLAMDEVKLLSNIRREKRKSPDGKP